MIKSLATVTALGALMIAPALAQTNPSPPPPTSPPAQHEATPPTPASPAPPKTGATSTPSQPKEAAAKPSETASKPQFISAQNPDQWLASSFKGTDVVGADGKKIGDVSDILFERNGTVKAYVIGVGGFLGIGAKEVALAPSSFQVVSGDKPSDVKLKLSMNKDELKQAATFQPYKPPAPPKQTTGTMGGGMSHPSGAPAPRAH